MANLWPICVTSLTHSTCSALYFRYQGLNFFHIWESESMDIMDDACQWIFFSKFKMADFWLILVLLHQQIYDVSQLIPDIISWIVLIFGNLEEDIKQDGHHFKIFENSKMADAIYVEWLTNSTSSYLWKYGYPVWCLLLWKEHCHAICCDNIGNLNALYLVEVEC